MKQRADISEKCIRWYTAFFVEKSHIRFVEICRRKGLLSAADGEYNIYNKWKILDLM